MAYLSLGIISLFPEMFTAVDSSIPGRAQQDDLLELHFWNPRDFAEDKYKTVDDRPYGGGPGMVMLFEPLKKTIDAAKTQWGRSTPVIHFSPQGKPLNQQHLERFIQNSRMILLCSRYEGVDERLIQSEIDEEYSIGDYVVSGGELPAMIFIDGLTRLIPGALGHPDSAIQDSFSTGLLDHPHYTRPEAIASQKVPDILLSGHHEAIQHWRLKQALGRTWQKRPDLLKIRTLTQLEKQLLNEFIDEDKK
jgi:tRNA (guanine37-N1)-methyltransferase